MCVCVCVFARTFLLFRRPACAPTNDPLAPRPTYPFSGARLQPVGRTTGKKRREERKSCNDITPTNISNAFLPVLGTLTASVRRSQKYQAPPPPKPSFHDPPLSERPKFTTNTKYRPSNQYTPKRSSGGSARHNHLHPPTSLQSPYSSFNRSINSAASMGGLLNQSMNQVSSCVRTSRCLYLRFTHN